MVDKEKQPVIPEKKEQESSTPDISHEEKKLNELETNIKTNANSGRNQENEDSLR